MKLLAKQLTTCLITVSLFSVIAGCGEDEPSNPVSTKSEKSFKRQGNINISVFVYRDIDRNGSYDLKDRPYSGLRVKLTGPNDTDVTQKSNIAGFTNYKMSLGNSVYPISEAGTYHIEAQLPENWVITSDNGSQSMEIGELEHSPAGLIAKNVLRPIGVAPELNIYGAVSSAFDAEEELKIIARSGDSKEQSVTLDQDLTFQHAAAPGQWEIEYHQSNHPVITHSVLIDDYPVRLSSLQNQQAPEKLRGALVTIDFDALTTSDTLLEIPNGYQGLNWDNWISTHQKLYGGPGYINGATSGEYIAYNSSGHPASFSSTEPFDLVRVMVSVAWYKAERGLIFFKAWRGEELAYQDQFYAHTAGPISYQPDYRNITKVEISTEHFWQVVLDDLSIRR